MLPAADLRHVSKPVSKPARDCWPKRPFQPHPQIFDIAPYGVPYALWGFVFLLLTQVCSHSRRNACGTRLIHRPLAPLTHTHRT